MEKKLQDLKKDYLPLKEKYSLPDFDELNKDFGIEKICESETEFILREIRKYIAEKTISYLRFIEQVLNPMNAPMFVFSFIKTLNSKEKEICSSVYKKLSLMELELIELDIVDSEEKDADFIKRAYDEWQLIKKEFMNILENAKKNWNLKTENKGKDYFQ